MICLRYLFKSDEALYKCPFTETISRVNSLMLKIFKCLSKTVSISKHKETMKLYFMPTLFYYNTSTCSMY